METMSMNSMHGENDLLEESVDGKPRMEIGRDEEDLNGRLRWPKE